MTISLSRRRFLGTAAAAAIYAAAPVLPAGATPLAGAGASVGVVPPARLPASLLTEWVREVYGLVRQARCSPPSAARIYAHIALAAWESVVPGVGNGRSLDGRLNGFSSSTSTRGRNQVASAQAIRFELALNRAITDTAVAVFADRSPDIVQVLAARGAQIERELSDGKPLPLVRRSIEHGRGVGALVAARAAADGYAGILGRPFTPPNGPEKWVPTPPNFGTSIEPYWAEVTSFTLQTNDEFKPVAPVPFSVNRGSAFYAEAMVTHDAVLALTDASRDTALYWRDNPDGTTGLPAGHWMLIACDVIDAEGLTLEKAAEVLVLLGLSLADGFTSCWTEKYETNLLRPVTYIKRHIDESWESFVNSPAFPEYTSGHSVGSAAAAAALTATLGSIPFTDSSSPLSKGLPSRRYGSFWDAAHEAAGSRLSGGIHYPMGIDAGITQGDFVARKVLDVAGVRRRN